MVRVLITVTPRMYRQAIALTIRRQRPGCDVRIAAPEDTEGELVAFRPHLLVHNDTDGLEPETVTRVLCRVTVLYSDGMDAQISLSGEVSETRDMSSEDLLRIVDMASALAGGAKGPG